MMPGNHALKPYPLHLADRHGEVEREPRKIAQADNEEEDHRRPARGKLLVGHPGERAGRGKIVDGENGAEHAQLVIEGIEIAGLEGDEKAYRTQQNRQKTRAPEGEFLRRLPFERVGECDRGQAEMEQVGVRPNGKELRITPALMITSARPHQPTKALSRSRAQVNSRTPPRMAVTVTFTADIVCMSRCMVRGSDPECRLGAHRRVGCRHNALYGRTTISVKIERSPANPALTAGRNMPTAKLIVPPAAEGVPGAALAVVVLAGALPA